MQRWNPATGAAAISAGSISAITTPGSVAPSATMRPQGIHARSEWPKVSRPVSRLPPGAAANTKQPFSMARARISTCQCASPVCRVNADGIARKEAPASASALLERGEAQVVTDRHAQAAPWQVGDDGHFSGGGNYLISGSFRRQPDRRRTYGFCCSGRRFRPCGPYPGTRRSAAFSGDTLMASEPIWT